VSPVSMMITSQEISTHASSTYSGSLPIHTSICHVPSRLAAAEPR
jgi:hypothetical protein